jgi:hypothetical protein
MKTGQLVWRGPDRDGHGWILRLVLPGLLFLAAGCGQHDPPQKVVDQAVRWELLKKVLEEDEEEDWTLATVSGTVTVYKDGAGWAFRETRR